MGKIQTILVVLLFLVLIMTVVLLDQRQLLLNKSIEIPNDSKAVSLEDTSFENFVFPEAFDIRKYEGVTLNFIVENNLNASVLSLETEEFTKLTGINIKIRPTDFDTMIQKINLDFISKSSNYHLIYVDPYQTLNRFYDDLEILDPYLSNDSLPNLQVSITDFFNDQLEVTSYFRSKDQMYAVPFDSTTMILYYRKDVFSDFKEQFKRAKGYDWTPGTEAFTWERFIEISEWIDTFVPNEIVAYGSGHMAQAHNSIFCEFSNILAANGGDFFSDPNANTLGRDHFIILEVLSDAFVKSLDQYKRAIKVAAPDSLNWNWEDSAEAFKRGEIAMMLNWDENYAALNDSPNFRVNGSVGTAILPYGDVRSANIYGGSGIGINKYATEREKEAAWFFITWATSKDMQLRILKEPTGGALPTVKTAYEALDEAFKASMPQIETVLKAWEPEYIYLRPKLKHFYGIEQILMNRLHDMLVNDKDPRRTAELIYEEIMRTR